MRPGIRLAALAGALVLASCVGRTTDSPAPIDIQTPGAWTSLAPMPSARQEVAVAELKGQVFVIGGFKSGGDPADTVEVYDPATDRWETRTPLPAPTHHAAAAVVDGRLFVAGGYRGRSGRSTLRLRRRGAVPHLQRKRDVRGGRPALDREGPDAHAPSRHRRRGGRQPDLRPRRSHPARPRRHERQRGVHAVIRRGL